MDLSDKGPISEQQNSYIPAKAISEVTVIIFYHTCAELCTWSEDIPLREKLAIQQARG